jgi:hypothetical protein
VVETFVRVHDSLCEERLCFVVFDADKGNNVRRAVGLGVLEECSHLFDQRLLCGRPYERLGYDADSSEHDVAPDVKEILVLVAFFSTQGRAAILDAMKPAASGTATSRIPPCTAIVTRSVFASARSLPASFVNPAGGDSVSSGTKKSRCTS